MNVADMNYLDNLLHLTGIVTVRFLFTMCVYAFTFKVKFHFVLLLSLQKIKII